MPTTSREILRTLAFTVVFTCLASIAHAQTFSLSKIHNGSFTQGQQGTYTLTVTNTGNAGTSGSVFLIDTTPTGLTVTSITGTGWQCAVPNANTGNCLRSDNLPAGQRYPPVTVTVSVAANAPTSLTNSATVSGGGTPGTVAASDPTTINPSPALSISKTHSGNFTQGQTGTYTITVRNSGAGPTPSGPIVQIFDNPPAGMTVTAMTGTGWFCATGMLNGCNRSDSLPAGQSFPPITVTVSVAANASSPLANVATASGGGTTGTVTASDPTTITQAGSPALSITKTHSGNFTQGQQGTYTLTISNTGTAPTPAGPIVQVFDNPPAGLTVTAMAGSGWICATGNFNGCNRADSLPAGQSFPPITMTVNVAANASTPLINVATAQGNGLNGPIVTASDPTTILSAGAITATAGSGQSTAVNTAFATALQAAVTDATGAPVPGRVVTFTAPATGPSGTWAGTTSLTVAATTDNAGRATAVAFTANATAGSYNVTATSGNFSTTFALTNTPAGSPALSITKAHTGVFTQGQQGNYTITISNTGTVPTSANASVQVQDTPPTGMAVTSMAGTGWQCTANNNTCSRSDSLPAGQSYPAVTVTVSIAANASTPLINIATATGGGTTGPVTAMDQTLIVGPSAGSIAATAGSGLSAALNGAFSTALQATVTSASGAPLSGASVTFTAPATGASGTWSGKSTVVVTTDTAGHATAPAFTANGIAGNYTVTATAGTASTTFALTNLAGANLSGPALVAPKTVGFDFTPGVSPATLTQNVTVSNLVLGSTPITYRVAFPNPQFAGWLSIAPSSLTTPAVLALTAASSNFPPGQYLAFVIVMPAGAPVRAPANQPPFASKQALQNREDETFSGSGVIIAVVMNIAGASPLTLMAPRCLWMSPDTDPLAAASDEETNFHCTYSRTSNPLTATYVLTANPSSDFAAILGFGTIETDWLSAQLGPNVLTTDTPVSGKTSASIDIKLQKDLLRYDRQLAYLVTGNDKSSQLGLINVAVGPALSATPTKLESDATTGTLKTTVPEAAIAKPIILTATGASLPFTAQADVPWISVNPSSGTASPGRPLTITVSVDPTGLKSAKSGGTVLFQRTDVSTPPTSVSVVSLNAVPGLPVITSVVNGASFQPPGIAPGAWVTIKGTGLSNGATGRTWRADELAGGTLPTALDGVSVTIDGNPAYLEYVSATQLNVLPAADSAQGEVAVIVNNNGRISAPVSAQLQPLSPAFFQSGNYAIAQRITPAPANVVVGNPAFQAARPGDVVTLWVSGLGPTSPAVRDGTAPSAGARVVATPTVQLGGVAVPDSAFFGAAISGFAATYQVNIRIPDSVPDGDVPIAISAGGFSSPDGVFIYVKR